MTIEEDLCGSWEEVEFDFEERAAMLEYDQGYDRYEAEQLAAQRLGFSNKASFKLYIQQLKAISK